MFYFLLFLAILCCLVIIALSITIILLVRLNQKIKQEQLKNHLLTGIIEGMYIENEKKDSTYSRI